MALPIGDYAIIGDGRTTAHVGKDGSIDWLCLPTFESAACFAALLGNTDNGRWKIAPRTKDVHVVRRYRPNTLVLETEFQTDTGRCRLTDFMPIETPQSELVRIVEGLSGTVDLDMELVIRFDYGRRVPWVMHANEDVVAIAGPDLLVLRTPVACHGKALTTVASFSVSAGERVPFVITHGDSHLALPPPTDIDAALQETCDYWTEWTSHCTYDGPWREAVVRSLITLKALIYRPTGGIIAAPTTSLPECIGGERNWDYRYCWLRDATFTLMSLMQSGYREDAEAWRAWLVRAAAGHPSQLQPIYSICGVQRIDEWEVPWLSGYEGSSPVRIGNGAATQLQLDTYGEVLDALHHARRANLAHSAVSWSLQRTLLEHLETLLDTPDCGIWEVRGPPQFFTHSRVMMWVAFDRGIAAVEDYGLDGPVARWREIRSGLHREICRRAVHPETGAFMQAYESEALDAATLLIPIVGFLPPDDPRIVATVRGIGQRLLRGGLVRRYDTTATDDGLTGGEGAFVACSFWYADVLALQGRRDEAKELFERLIAFRNDVGLLPEEIDPYNGRMLGNFPQGLSHLALIDTAHNLLDTGGPANERPKHGRKVVE